MCNRLGALWADFTANEVDISTKSDTGTYRWDDRKFEIHHCTTCGCTTHYTGLTKDAEHELGINLRMLDRRQLEIIPIQAQ
jgi:hypothetical protein